MQMRTYTACRWNDTPASSYKDTGIMHEQEYTTYRCKDTPASRYKYVILLYLKMQKYTACICARKYKDTAA